MNPVLGIDRKDIRAHVFLRTMLTARHTGMLPLFAAATFCLALLPARGQDKTPTKDLGQATLLYRELYGLKKLEAEVSGSSNVVMVIRMTSKRGVPVEQLQVFIDSQEGRVPLHFAPDGSFLMLMSDRLYEENPYVRANQPKGTMRLDWGFFVKGIKGLDKATTYRELIAPLEESRKVLATMGKHIPEMKNASVTGMKLFFVPDSPVKITIQSKRRPRVFEPDKNGVCLIPHDSSLLREDPPVNMPVAPERIDFVIEGVR